MLKHPIPLAILSLVLLLVAACGGGKEKAIDTPEPTAEPSATAEPTPAPPPQLRLPGEAETDRIVISKIGVDAPLTLRRVGPDGVMTNPQGPDDIAYYDFDQTSWPGVGGAPGFGGNVVLAGHVDWGGQHGVGCKNNSVRPPCQAVLWDLGKLKAGDIVEIHVDDNVYRYEISGTKSYPASYSAWEQVFSSPDQEVLTIVTCTGDFNPSSREYNSRLVVSATRV